MSNEKQRVAQDAHAQETHAPDVSGDQDVQDQDTHAQEQGTKFQDTRSQDTQDQDTYDQDTHAQDTSNQDKFTTIHKLKVHKIKIQDQLLPKTRSSQANSGDRLLPLGVSTIDVRGSYRGKLGWTAPQYGIVWRFFHFLALRRVFGIYSEWFLVSKILT